MALVLLCLCLVYWQYWEWQYERERLLRNAAAMGNTTAVRAFLDSGVNPNAESLVHQQSALEMATYSGHEDIVRLLLDRGANPNRAVHAAARRGRTNILAILVARGASVSGKAGASTLNAAVDSKNVATINFVLRQGVNVNAPRDYGMPAILHAASNGSWEVYSTLVEHGADVTVRTSSGMTTLMCAASGENPVICRDLIRRRLDVNARDEQGKTALMHAVLFNRADEGGDSSPVLMAVLEMLLHNGADATLRDKAGRSALSYAASSRISKAKLLLRKAGAEF